MSAHLLIAALASLAAVTCSPGIGAPAPIAGTSKTFVVRGSYAPVALDRVDRLSVEDGRLVLHGSSSTVTVDLPRSADPARPNRRWALVSESNGERTRTLTFTHEESLDDLTIELPAGEAPIRFGGFSGRDGNDVLVLAWGEGFRSYRAELTIVRPAASGGAPAR